MPSLLDLFCGLGGVSDGFAAEGFDVLGIDIVDAPNKLGYKHKFIHADIRDLKGEDYRGYDVIWGRPPCRDFGILAKTLGHATWKNPPSPENGLKIVDAFLKFVKEANPTFWVMENVTGLTEYLKQKPRANRVPISPTMFRSFWGNYPTFLFPTDGRKGKLATKVNGKQSHMRINGKIPKWESWERAKIPLACSRAFAVACKEALTLKTEASS